MSGRAPPIASVMSKISMPLVGVSCCLKPAKHGFAHSVNDKYVDAVRDAAECVPVLIPAIGERLAMDAMLDRLDGLVFTGSPSNVDPGFYGGPSPRPDNMEDLSRDATTLPLIRAALKRGLPVFGICRGIQEINVALGGSLHQHLQEIEGRRDHRSIKTVEGDERYRIVHQVKLTPGGKLERILGKPEIGVNSLHGQGIDRIADDLAAEALAEDGTIEAVSHKTAASFFLAVQWHPEFQVMKNPDYLALFQAFSNAVREYEAQR